MFEYSVITPVAAREQEFYIIPLSEEERYLSPDGTDTYEYARLDLMLEILNGYQAMGHAEHFETEHYRYTRQAPQGMLAKAVLRSTS